MKTRKQQLLSLIKIKTENLLAINGLKLNEMAKDLEEKVAGEYNTFRVYLYVLKKKSVGVRDAQHDLGFSSPHLAAYHLKNFKILDYSRKKISNM